MEGMGPVSMWVMVQMMAAPLLIPAMFVGAIVAGVVGRRFKRPVWTILLAPLLTDVFACLVLLVLWDGGGRRAWAAHPWFKLTDAIQSPWDWARGTLRDVWEFQALTLLPSVAVAGLVALVVASLWLRDRRRGRRGFPWWPG